MCDPGKVTGIDRISIGIILTTLLVLHLFWVLNEVILWSQEYLLLEVIDLSVLHAVHGTGTDRGMLPDHDNMPWCTHWWWMSRAGWKHAGRRTSTDSYRGGCSGSLLPTQIVNLSTTIRTWHWNEWHNKRGIVPSRSKLKKENYIESFHGKSGPWAQEVNLKILRKFLGCRAILLNDWLSLSWRFTYWELSNDVKIMGVP